MRFLLLSLIIFGIFINSTAAGTCKMGRGACVASCVAQNCATGYCPQGENGVCVCSRCNNGPSPIYQPPR